MERKPGLDSIKSPHIDSAERGGERERERWREREAESSGERERVGGLGRL